MFFSLDLKNTFHTAGTDRILADGNTKLLIVARFVEKYEKYTAKNRQNPQNISSMFECAVEAVFPRCSAPEEHVEANHRCKTLK